MFRSVLQHLFLPHALLLTAFTDCDILFLAKASPGELKGAFWLPCAGDAFAVILSFKTAVYIHRQGHIVSLHLQTKPLECLHFPRLYGIFPMDPL